MCVKFCLFVCFQLNISYPATGCQKLIDIDDEHKVRGFYDKRMAAEVDAGCLGDEWKVSAIKLCHTSRYQLAFIITHRNSDCQLLVNFLEILLKKWAIFNSFASLKQGYIVRISGGNDKQGFPMKQGVLTTGRVRLLLSKGHSCYRPRRSGERRRKSVRGCIVDAQLSVLNLVIIKKGNF